jgi:hypothetical protein
MSVSPMLLLHICSGTVGVLSGFTAVSLKKGSRRHAIAGIIFAVAMLSLGATGAYMAVLKVQPGNILGGALTFYLVATAWTAARHSDGRTRIFDWAALLVILSVAAVEITFGVQAALSPTGLRYDYPPGPFFTFGAVALIATIGDVRMLVRHGIFGAQRIARHLWRMCFGLFIASASIFLARPHLFPAFMRKTGMLMILSFAPLVLLIVWLIRVLAGKRWAAFRNRKPREQQNIYAPLPAK